MMKRERAEKSVGSCTRLPPTESAAEFYSRMEDDFDETVLTQSVCAKESESLHDWIKRLWYKYAFPRPKIDAF